MTKRNQRTEEEKQNEGNETNQFPTGKKSNGWDGKESNESRERNGRRIISRDRMMMNPWDGILSHPPKKRCLKQMRRRRRKKLNSGIEKKTKWMEESWFLSNDVLMSSILFLLSSVLLTEHEGTHGAVDE